MNFVICNLLLVTCYLFVCLLFASLESRLSEKVTDLHENFTFLECVTRNILRVTHGFVAFCSFLTTRRQVTFRNYYLFVPLAGIRDRPD